MALHSTAEAFSVHFIDKVTYIDPLQSHRRIVDRCLGVGGYTIVARKWGERPQREWKEPHMDAEAELRALSFASLE